MTGGYIGPQRSIANLDSYTKAQADALFARKEFQSEQPRGDIGTPGTYGFGAGVHPNESALSTYNLTPLFANDQQTSDTFGNYIHSNGSVMVFIPTFYFRTGNTSADRYSEFGANTIEIRGRKHYANEAEANADGFILHRAFINNGAEQDGVFVDKYMASKSPDDSNIAVSMRYGVPISLDTDTAYTNSSGMTGCSGELHDAVTLSRARGSGYQCNNLFVYSAIAMLSLAHAQNSTAQSVCAWYDGTYTTAYPKGCNDGNLGDESDPDVEFVTAGDSGYSGKPQTGSGQPFEKTTHNGQQCGIADVNGGMREVSLGITQPGSSSTASADGQGNTFWMLNESVDIATLTSGWNGATDAWGDQTHLDTLYTSFTAPIDMQLGGSWAYWGDGDEPVFFNSTSGIDRALNGILVPAETSHSPGGINIIGNDGIYRRTRENLFVQSCGYWSDGSNAGVFARNFGAWRSDSDRDYGFRSALYV